MDHSAEVDDVEINERAPIILTGEVDIAADIGAVWNVLAAIERWPSWNPEVKSASLQGDLAAGTGFRWRAGGARLASRLVCVDAPHRIAWTGKAMGLSVVHL